MRERHYRLFVYGSLKEGNRLHHILGRSEYLGTWKTKPDFVLYNFGAFPAMHPVRAGSGVEVVGEVYSVQEQLLEYLDVVESTHQDLYRRASFLVHDQLGEEMRVLGYIWPRLSPSNTVESGCWAP